MRTASESIAITGNKGSRQVHIQTDCTAPENVEIVLDKDGKRIWINCEGICLLRICRAASITLFDNRDQSLEEWSKENAHRRVFLAKDQETK
jgi:hypothetical protein